MFISENAVVFCGEEPTVAQTHALKPALNPESKPALKALDKTIESQSKRFSLEGDFALGHKLFGEKVYQDLHPILRSAFGIAPRRYCVATRSLAGCEALIEACIESLPLDTIGEES